MFAPVPSQTALSVPHLLLWLLPAMFLLHDAEEALLLPAWLRRNRDRLAQRFPRLSRRLLPHLASITPAKFIVMACEELLLLLAATCCASFGGSYYPWLALFLAFALHCVVHLVQTAAAGMYVPAAATSAGCLAGCAWVICRLVDARVLTPGVFVWCLLAGCLIAAVNLRLLHRAVGKAR